jgi:cysteine desulfuration protein SufE
VLDSINSLPRQLQDIVEDFQMCEGHERLELLLQFAEEMPPLPDWLETNHGEMDQVEECMTPVYVHASRENGKLLFHFDVPRSSPTVRGFATILKRGCDNLTPEEILAIPGDFYLFMGLEEMLTFQRLNGIAAILAHMKQLALDEMERGRDQ